MKVEYFERKGVIGEGGGRSIEGGVRYLTEIIDYVKEGKLLH